MSTTLHPRDQLSAYLDGALTPAERTAVGAHLETCADCRARLAELRGVAVLLASLPESVPSRRLTPRVAAVPAWLAPLRTLTTLASGISVFLFMASAILANIGFLAAGSASTAASGAAPIAPPVPAASAGLAQDRAAPTAGPSNAAKVVTSSAPEFSATTPAPTPAPGTAFAAQAPDRTSSGFTIGPSPWVWLMLAVITGVIALALQRRLRSV